MSVLYRPVRSTLKDSMAEVKEFDELLNLFNWLVIEKTKLYGKSPYNLYDLYVSYIGYDIRNDWYTYAITSKRYFEENFFEIYHSPQIIGYLTFR